MEFRSTAILLLLLAPCVLSPAASGQVPAMSPSAPAPPAPAPNAAPTTIQARSNLVVVDVVVTGRDHSPIHGLKALDFQVREGDTPQVIKSFEEHAAPSAPAPVPPLSLPPGVFTNFTPTPLTGAVNILLIDRLNTPLESQPFLHDQLVQFLTKMKPGTSVAIFGLTQRLIYLQGFTADPKLLLAALTAKKNLPRQSALLNPPLASEDSLSANMSRAQPQDDAGFIQALATLKQFEAVQQSEQTQLRVRYTLEAMDTLARYLSSIPGRKNLLWFSGSFPISILPDGDLPNPFSIAADMQAQFRETTNLLSRAQVSVYPIDARGLQNSPVLDSSRGGSNYARNPTAFAKDNAQFVTQNANEQSTMREMAQETGGAAFVNTNGLADAATKAIDLGSSFYTMTYTPTNSRLDGSFRKIQLSLSGKTADLAYRRGYYADPPEKRRTQLTASPSAQPNPERQALRDTMVRGVPTPTQILFKLFVAPAGPATDEFTAEHNNAAPATHGPFRRYSVNYAAVPQDISYKVASPGQYEASVEFITFVYDADGVLVNSLADTAHAHLDTDALRKLLQGGVEYHQVVSVPAKGDFFLRVAVHDLNNDHIGAIEIPVQAVRDLPVVPVPVAKPQTAPKAGPAPPTLNNLPN